MQVHFLIHFLTQRSQPCKRDGLARNRSRQDDLRSQSQGFHAESSSGRWRALAEVVAMLGIRDRDGSSRQAECLTLCRESPLPLSSYASLVLTC